MKKSIIAEIGSNKEIGEVYEGEIEIPWRNCMSRCRERFKEITQGKTLLLGRIGYEVLRKNIGPQSEVILVTSNGYVANERVSIVKSFSEGVQSAESKGVEELVIAGGEKIFKEAMEGEIDMMYLSLIYDSFPDANAFFPNYIEEEWKPVLTQRFSPDHRNRYSHGFIDYMKRGAGEVIVKKDETKKEKIIYGKPFKED
jgi:dihydrofolate reductase